MKKQTQHSDVSVPQSVTGFIKLRTAGQSIQIGFTDQKVSAHAGLASFAGFLHERRLRAVLAHCLPQPQRRRSDALPPADLALGFIVGLLRFRVFSTGGIVSRSGGWTTIRLAVPPHERAWWRCVFEKLTSRFPNCNSVPFWSS